MKLFTIAHLTIWVPAVIAAYLWRDWYVGAECALFTVLATASAVAAVQTMPMLFDKRGHYDE